MADQTVGLVGKSGSGKSTVINFLERFYEPLGGDILLDEEASMEVEIRAAKAANAHNFIHKLPDITLRWDNWKLKCLKGRNTNLIGAFYLRAMTMRTMSKKMLLRHRNGAVSSKKESHKQPWYAGVGLFISQFLTSALTALIFWENYSRRGKYDSRHIKSTSSLKSAFKILQRGTKMNLENSVAIKPENINGDIEFKQVYFSYPARPEQIIMRGLSLKIEAEKVVGLVGRSGARKSTTIRLIERFYDTLSVSVEIDEIDIKFYNLRALRSHMALVSQEPAFFSGTIRDNIGYAKENATEAEIIEAATSANAHDFISYVKDGYETYCGERGVQLSGGQKQRIALARAILKNPAIFLLDEATSAVDVNSEKLVQEALDRTMLGRTCLVVAHRLSTIQKANKLVVIDQGTGRVIEEGNHSELLAEGAKRAYYSLVKLQQLSEQSTFEE
ncbi:unnamed protein product [Dovyalis caffra]|uniref:ABC transporter domain-containing protein n=1 Tax=Dovyalis caffra TaxID=77055 RepID=A0AAV1S2R1_9ROSI|nr:unnamed protein product [Dovyalis caffra]